MLKEWVHIHATAKMNANTHVCIYVHINCVYGNVFYTIHVDNAFSLYEIHPFQALLIVRHRDLQVDCDIGPKVGGLSNS